MKKAKKSAKQPTDGDRLGTATTLGAARSITGLSMATIRAAKDRGCRAFTANGRIDCDELMKFVETMPELPEHLLDLQLERAKDIRASRLLKEQRLKEREKQLWPIELIRQSWARNCIAAKMKFQNSADAIAADVSMRVGLTQAQADVLRQVVAKNHRDALLELFKGQWGKCICPSCNQEIAP